MNRLRLRNLWAGACALVVAFCLLTPGLSDLHTWLWWIAGAAVVAVIAGTAIFGQLWSKSAWWCIAAACAALVAADSSYTSGVIPSDFSPALGAFVNATYGLAYLLLIAATLILLNRRRRGPSDISGMLDSAVVLVAAAMAAAEYLIYPLWQSQSINSGQRATLITFEVLNLFLIATTARLWFASDRSVNRSVRALAVGLLVLICGAAVGLAVWLPQSSGTDVATLSRIIELSGLAFFGIVGFAVLDPTSARPPAGDIDAGVTARSRVLAVLGLCILVPPVLLLFTTSSTFSGSRAFLAMTLILTGLLGLRVNLLIQGYSDAVRREHILREINAGLMRATDMEEVNSRLDDWAGRLVEQNGVTCLLGTFDELAARGVGALGARLRAADGEIRYRTVVTVPGTRPQRRLVVETHEIISSPAQTSLAVLGQSVGMALERLALSRRFVERETTQRLELLLHNASDIIALVDNNGQISYVTEAIKELTDLGPTQLLGLQWPELFQDPSLARGLLDQARTDDESRGDLVIDRNAYSGDGDIYVPRNTEPDRRLEVDVAWLADEAQFVVTHHDVTDRYLLEQQLAFQAFHDELTGLNNRSVFRAELARASARSRRSGSTFAVMMIDLDDFKNVNDSYGHPAGDELLRVVAKRLVECMREGDTPVRLGGDEFAVILESARSAEDAEAVAARLLGRLDEPVALRGTDIVTGASIGIAISDGTPDPADVERDADIALYDAKFAGKGRVAVFRSDMHDSALRKMSLTNQLRGALDRDEIVVRYQPVFELSTNAIVGAEALVRWNHPTRGELGPDVFIALAEETGAIIDIGRFVINRALQDMAAWKKKHPQHAGMRMSINLSGRQLAEDEVAAALASAMRETKSRASQIIVEVTESILLPDDGAAAQQLQAISDLGISVYIDDFGTGWASLHYLRSLPVNGLKLAQEFVRGLPAEFDDGLARAIRELSTSLNFEQVVAEGVETAAQRDALIGLGYRLGQGYLMSRPVLPERMSLMLAKASPAEWNAPETDVPAASVPRQSTRKETVSAKAARKIRKRL